MGHGTNKKRTMSHVLVQFIVIELCILNMYFQDVHLFIRWAFSDVLNLKLTTCKI